MRNSVLPIMSVLTVVAGAVGLQMGESAIAQIDPLYFEGSPGPPRDVTKDPRPQRPGGFLAASGWEEGYQARAADCGDCPVSASRGAYVMRAPQPAFHYSDPTIEPRWEQAVATASADDLRIERSLQASSVQRYLHYPVSADQAEIRAGLEGEPPAPAPEVDEPEATTGL